MKILLSNLHLLSYSDIDTIIHALTFSLPQKSFNSLPLRGFLHHFLIWIIPQQIDSLLQIVNRIGSCQVRRISRKYLTINMSLLGKLEFLIYQFLIRHIYLIIQVSCIHNTTHLGYHSRFLCGGAFFAQFMKLSNILAFIRVM